VTAPNVKQPVAPPIYRPQQAPKVLQTKTSSSQSRQAGQAPRLPVGPVLNWQQGNKTVQPKAITPPQKSPTPPPVYRPEPKRIAQPKMTANTHPLAKLSPAYRQQPLPKVLQTKKSCAPSPPSVQRQAKALDQAKVGPANRTDSRAFTPRGATQANARNHYSTIQRTLTVNYSAVHAGADINSPTLRGAVDNYANVAKPLSLAEKSALKAAISQANTANAAAADVPALADAIVGHYAGWAIVSAVNKTRIKGILEDLMGARLATGMTTANEETAFDDLIGRATRTSRAKGQPNEVAIGNLPVHLANAIRTQVSAAKSRDQSFHSKSQKSIKKIYRNNVVAKLDEMREEASTGMAGIRMVHFAGDGWLPAVPVGQIANFGTLDRALTADEISQAHWYQYALSAGGASPFIEFDIGTVSGIGGWRLIFDYVNRNFYLSLHYNWHSGYNPFFKLTDA
jgi:hypothetical protein